MLSLFSRVKAPVTKARKRPTTRRATFERLEDRTLLSAGMLLTSIPGTTSDSPQASFLDSGGNLVVGGFAGNYPTSDFAALRYQTNYQNRGVLALDSNFGNGGSVVTHVGSAGHSNYAYAGASDPSGKFVLAGQANSTQDFALARYNANGTLDTTFGGKSPNIPGTVTTDLGGDDKIKGVMVQPDGSIVVAGSSSAGGIYHAVLGRYTATGSLDTTFGGQGTGFSANPFPGYANLFTTLRGCRRGEDPRGGVRLKHEFAGGFGAVYAPRPLQFRRQSG